MNERKYAFFKQRQNSLDCAQQLLTCTGPAQPCFLDQQDSVIGFGLMLKCKISGARENHPKWSAQGVVFGS